MRTKDRASEIADGNPMADDSNERRISRPMSSRAIPERATMNPGFRHKSPNPKGAMVRRFLCIVAVSILATMGFQSIAAAQTTDCSGAAEQLQAERPNVPAGTIEMYLNFVPDVGGCLSFEGTTFIGGLSVPVYDPDTGEELGILKDLDPDLTSGSFSVTYEEFCGGFIPQSLTAQEYFEQTANAQEQAILDPDSDGAACTSDDDAFLSGDVGEPSVTDDPQCIDGILDRDGDGEISPVEAAQAGADATQGINPCAGTEGGGTGGEDGNGGGEAEGGGDCAGADEQLGIPSDVRGSFGGIFFPDAGGCIYLTGALVEITLDQLNAPVFDPGTGEELGLMKDLDPDLASGDFSVTYDEFCGAFPTSEAEGFSYAGLTAQEYYDQLANAQEQSILDPDSDGLACTSDDEAFLSGDYSDYEGARLEQTWVGQITQTWDDGDTLETEVEANIMPISEMTEDTIGEAVGEVRYVGFCTQTWILKEVNEDSVVVEGRLEDPNSSCVEFVPITLTPREDGSLEYYYSDTEYTGGSVGEGVLTLQGSGDYDETGFGQFWNGLVTQTAQDGTESEFWVDANIIPISEMTDDLIGEVVGEVSLVGLDCGGVWVLEEVNADYVVVEERITAGTTENCVEFVPITLTPRDDGALEYFYLDMNESVGKCVLTRRGGGLPDNDDDTRKPSERMRVLGINNLPDTGGLSLLAPLGGLSLVSGALGVAAALKRRTR